MLTTVILDGAMGKLFGREWEFAISSPREALNMVEANKPGVLRWVRENLAKFSSYRVTCEYEDGNKEDLDSEGYEFQRKLKSVRFTPIITGQGHAFKVVIGVVLVVVGSALLARRLRPKAAP